MANYNFTMQRSFIPLILTVYIIIFSILAFAIVGAFDEIFRSLGATLPMQTELLLSSYKYWGILAVIPAIAFYNSLQKDVKVSASLLIGTIFISILLLLFTIWGIYSPVL